VHLLTPDGAEYEARVVNLSEGGMLVASDFLLPACSICAVRGDDFEAQATVLRASEARTEFAMALHFEPLPSLARTRVRELVRAAA
jgi:hypothetical protein